MSNPLSFLQISKDNLVHNISEFRKLLPPNTKIAGVVKANAYGHGSNEVVPIIDPYVDLLQVDDIEELRQVRKLSEKEILLFGYVQRLDVEEAASLGATFGVYDIDRIELLNKIGSKLNKQIKIHLKIDALLGRQGILPEELEKYLLKIKNSPNLNLEAIYSHFSNIEDTENLDHARRQHEILVRVKTEAGKYFPNIRQHISATSGAMSQAEGMWDSNMVRLGMGMYGLWPSFALKEKLESKLTLRPVMKWVTKIAQVKEVPKGFPVGYGLTHVTERPTKIALIPQGYSDGYDRKFSNKGVVLIGGQRAKVLGRVAMNMFAVDVTDLPNVQVEDEVVLIGRQGDGEIPAEELAENLGRINYEIVARISALLPRFVV